MMSLLCALAALTIVHLVTVHGHQAPPTKSRWER
jgi:hypothetical protein